MAAERSSGEEAHTGEETHALRSIDVRSAARFGALLSGVAALVQGSVALMIYGLSLGRAGFVATWASGMLYAGRSLVGLMIMTLVAVALGALLWAIGAFLYNVISRATGGLKLTWR
jgi:Transmembrane domain of unknown function (DUF3566)